MIHPTGMIEMLTLLAFAGRPGVADGELQAAATAVSAPSMAQDVPGAIERRATGTLDDEWLRAAGERWSLSLRNPALAAPPLPGDDPGSLGFGGDATADSAGNGAAPEREEGGSPPGGGDAAGELPGRNPAAMSVRPSPSATTALLFMEGFLAAYSCIGFAKDGGQILGGLNSLGALSAIGATVFDPSPGLTIEGQLALGGAWLALAAFQFDQSDRRAPASQVAIGNMVGIHAVVVLASGVDWVAKRLHGAPHPNPVAESPPLPQASGH